MTKEEAIQHLEEMKKGIFLWDMSELIDLCISALSENKGDLISREELTKNLKSVTEWNGEIHRYIDEQGINSIPSVENKGEWIPVSERLPEPEDKQEVKVIVSYENEDGEFVEKGVFNKRYGFNYPSVKAWQPLPEPYKEGGNE